MLDIVIVGYIFYRVYKLLKGTAAFNIFIGVALFYVISWIVSFLEMRLLSQLLGSFVSLGLVILIIIFQPEVRRFLLMMGNNTLKGRMSYLDKYINKLFPEGAERPEAKHTQAIFESLQIMSKESIGALIVISKPINLEYFADKGIILNAEISSSLIRTIFASNTPLHDGAMIISNGIIHSASAVLPLSNSNNIHSDLGMRHRAAIGVTEIASVASFIVSEENGNISYCYNGELEQNIPKGKLKARLNKHLSKIDN